MCCRPPGHHAGVDGATDGAPSSGFSILNNAMIGTFVGFPRRVYSFLFGRRTHDSYAAPCVSSDDARPKTTSAFFDRENRAWLC